MITNLCCFDVERFREYVVDIEESMKVNPYLYGTFIPELETQNFSGITLSCENPGVHKELHGSASFLANLPHSVASTLFSIFLLLYLLYLQS